MKKYIYILSFIALALAFTQCSNRDSIDSKEVDLQLILRAGLYSATDNGTAQENVIITLRTMVFFSNGAIDVNQYTASGLPGGFTTIPIVEEMTIKSGRKIFCVIANEPASLMATLNGITKFDQLKDIVLSNENTYNVAGTPLPFSVTHTEEIRFDRVLPLEIGLQRSVGKVQMKIIKDTDNTKITYLKSVQVVRTPTKSTIIAGYPQNPSTAGLLTFIARQTYPANTAVSPTVGSELEITPLYLYEHYEGTGDVAMGKATALRLEVEINGVDKFFEIPLIGEFIGATPVYAVKRNTIANLYVTAYGDRINVQYEILPWDDKTYNKDPGIDDSNITCAEWFDVDFYEAKYDKDPSKDDTNIKVDEWGNEIKIDIDHGKDPDTNPGTEPPPDPDGTKIKPDEWVDETKIDHIL